MIKYYQYIKKLEICNFYFILEPFVLKIKETSIYDNYIVIFYVFTYR